jgi:hypothetical protein
LKSKGHSKQHNRTKLCKDIIVTLISKSQLNQRLIITNSELIGFFFLKKMEKKLMDKYEIKKKFNAKYYLINLIKSERVGWVL